MKQIKVSQSVFEGEMERHYAQTSKRPNTIRGTLSDFPEATTDYYTDGALVARYHHRHKFGVIF